ncbi:unnamed protein product [Notodromas monacha]|uniref:non-specific serine/threonine protein kinase n=1 Tax=Notodromas monacha TaxID=399045 RepID=A0A7R9GL31_9CRUS|nr:unnamed protein product [Notodromas monacha]CAG0925272.1 unnamed protein product [Notodromas monacha]
MVGDVVKIGDFGVAKELGTSFGKEAGCSLVSLKKIKLLDLSSDEEEEDGEENKDGFVRGSEAAVNSGDAGTPVYADPEQLKGKSCSAKSDIYSLGLVTLEMYLPCATQMEKAKVFEQLRLSRSFPQRAKFPVS